MANGLFTAGQYRATSSPWKRDILKRPESVEETPWSFDEYFDLIKKSYGGYQGLDKLSPADYNRRILENLFLNMHGVDRRNLDKYSDADLQRRTMISSILGPGGSLVNLYNLFPSPLDVATTDQRLLIHPLKLAMQLRSGNIPGAGKTAQTMWQDIRKSPGKAGRGLFPVPQLVPRGAGLVRAGGASGLFGLGSPAHLPVVNPFSQGRDIEERRNIYTGELIKPEHLTRPQGKRAAMRDLVANWTGMQNFVDKELVLNFFPRVKHKWEHEPEDFLEKSFGRPDSGWARGDIDVKDFWNDYTTTIYFNNPNERKGFEANLKMMLEKYPEVSPAHVAALEHVMWGRTPAAHEYDKSLGLHLSEIVSGIYQLALGKMPNRLGDPSPTDRLIQLVHGDTADRSVIQYAYDKQSRQELVSKGKFYIDHLKRYEYDKVKNNYLPPKEWVDAAKVVIEKLQNLTQQTLRKKLGISQSPVLPETITFFRGAKKGTRTGRIGDLTPVAFTRSGAFLGDWEGGFDVRTKELDKKYKGVSKFPIDISMMRWMVAHDENKHKLNEIYEDPGKTHAWIGEEEFLIHKTALQKSEQYQIEKVSLADKSLRPGLLMWLKMKKGGLPEILRTGSIVYEASSVNVNKDIDNKIIDFDKLDASEKHFLNTLGVDSHHLTYGTAYKKPQETIAANIQLSLLKEKILEASDVNNTKELVKQVLDMEGELTEVAHFSGVWDELMANIAHQGTEGSSSHIINPYNYSEARFNRILNLQSPFSSFPGIQQISKEAAIDIRGAITGYDPLSRDTQVLFDNRNLLQNQTQFFSDALLASGLSKYLHENHFPYLDDAIRNIVKESSKINTIAERMEFYDITEERNWLQKNTGMVKKLSSFEERSGSPELIRKMQYIINSKLFRLMTNKTTDKYRFLIKEQRHNLIKKIFGNIESIETNKRAYELNPETVASIQLWKSITETPEAKKIISMYQQGLKNYKASIEQANITGKTTYHVFQNWIAFKNKYLPFHKRNLTEETLENLLRVKSFMKMDQKLNKRAYEEINKKEYKDILDKAVILYTWTQPEHFFADPENVKSFVKQYIRDYPNYPNAEHLTFNTKDLTEHAMKTKVQEVNYYQRDREEATLKNLYQYFTTGDMDETKKIAAEKMYRILVKHFLQKRQSVSKSQETGEYTYIATERGSIPLYNLNLGLQHVGGRSVKETLKSMREKLRKD